MNYKKRGNILVLSGMILIVAGYAMHEHYNDGGGAIFIGLCFLILGLIFKGYNGDYK